jgi:hypothetical protein
VRQVIERFNVWFSYVASKANIADMPSRGAIAEMAQVLRRTQPDFTIEDSAVRVVFPDISDGWLERAAASIPASRRPRAVSGSRRGPRA